MLIFWYLGETLYGFDGKRRFEVSDGVIEEIRGRSLVILMDLSAHGLRVVDRLFDGDISAFRVRSYRLNIYKLSYRRLTFKNASLFGLDIIDETSWADVQELESFLWRTCNSSLYSSEVVSSASVAGRCMGKGWFLKSCPESLAVVEESYFGGRLQVFKTGRFERVNYFDFPSAYGNILGMELPVGVGLSQEPDINKPGFYLAEYDSRGGHIRLPSRHGATGGTEYLPAGRGVYWHKELLSVTRGGGVVKLISGAEVISSGRPFMGVSRALLRERMLGSKHAKLVINSVYGKLATKYSEYEDVLIFCEPFSTGNEPFEFVSYKRYGRAVLIRRGVGECRRPERSNVAAAAVITSEARIKLNAAVGDILAAGGDVLYVDTDSVFWTGGVPPGLAVSGVGRLELRGARDYEFEKSTK